MALRVLTAQAQAETGLGTQRTGNDDWKQSVPLPGRCARSATTTTTTTRKQTACRVEKQKTARNLHLDEFNDDDENDATKILIDPQDEAAARSPQTQHTTHDIAMKTMGRCGSVTAAAAAAVGIAVAVAVVAASNL